MSSGFYNVVMLVLKKILNLFWREQIFIPLIIGIAVIISVLPDLYYFSLSQKDTYYTFAHNYIPDYYQYISHMKDGADGKILMTFRSGPDNFARKPVYLFYTASGFIFAKLGINLFTGYFLMRIIFCLIKFLIIYYLLWQLFTKSSTLRKLSFFLIWFSTPFYQLPSWQILYPTITSIDPLLRTLFLPHDLLTTTLLILAAIFFNRYLADNGKIKHSIASGLFFLFAIITNPAMLTTFAFYFSSAVGIYFIINKDYRKKLFIGLIIVGVIALPLYFYYQFLFTTTLPFSLIYNNQKSIDYHFGLKEFILIGGPVILLAVFSLRRFLLKKDLLSQLIITWAFVPLLLFYLYGKILPISSERILESGFYIPIAILAAVTIYYLPKNLFKLVAILLLVIISIPYFYLSLTKQLQEYNPNLYNIYIPYLTIEAFNWLDKNSLDESVATAGYFSSNLMIAFSHNKAIFGHDYSVYRGKERWNDVLIIYGKDSTVQQIKAVLNKDNVSYIVFTPDNVSYDQTNLASVKNIRLVFSNGSSSIYYYDRYH